MYATLYYSLIKRNCTAHNEQLDSNAIVQYKRASTDTREQTYSHNPFCTKGISLTQPNWMPNSRTSNVVLQEELGNSIVLVKSEDTRRSSYASIGRTEEERSVLDTKTILQRVE